jgi:Family of unknown function (DUF6283)
MTPCKNCPYRIDAPRKLWHRSEFVQLLEKDSSELGATYACHNQIDLAPKDRTFCAGWLLDQKKRGVPSILLRIQLSNNERALVEYNTVSDAGIPMFPTVKAMCRANGVRPSLPPTDL